MKHARSTSTTNQCSLSALQEKKQKLAATLSACFAAILLLLPFEPARSQSLDLQPRGAQLQRDALSALEREARRIAGNDEARFTAIIRRGLSRLPEEIKQSERTIGGGSIAAVTAGVDQPVSINDLDQDPQIQSSVKKMLEDGKRFNTRMIGSSPVAPGAHPQTVAILKGTELTGCTGIVVAPGALLTAAHCVCDFDLTRQSKQIAFGESIREAGHLAATIPSQTRVYPANGAAGSNFCDTYRQYGICSRDIALVRFDTARMPEPFSSMSKIKFANKTDVEAARRRVWETSPSGPPLPIEVVGFGVSRMKPGTATFSYDSAGTKLSAPFTFFRECLVDSMSCRPNLPADACLQKLEITIIDQSGHSDSCQGDSGGPAFVKTLSNEWKLAGLVSRAIRQSGECGPGGLYSYVYTDKIIEWLRDNGVTVDR